MTFASALARHVLFPLVEIRDGTNVLSSLRNIRPNQALSESKLDDLRHTKLRNLMRHAFETSPFYRQRFQESGVTPDAIQSFDDLKKIPPLTKDDLVGHIDDMVSTAFEKDKVHRNATGGSTGRHTPFYRDNACVNVKRAAQHRFCEWTGWRFGETTALIWPARQDFAEKESLKSIIRNRFVDRSTMLFSGNLNEEVLAAHAQQLVSYKPKLIRAFPNPLDQLAKYIQSNGISPIRPKGVVTVGEPLLETQRKLFEETFDCPVFDCYVSRECGHMACECEEHDGMHINADCLHLEFVVDNRPALPGEQGNILVTDLENFGMPFIRYQIGDMGSPVTESCKCGRSFPLMRMAAGRISDFLTSPVDGSLVPGTTLCHYLLAEGPNVGQLQIIQDKRDHLLIRVKQGDSRTESLQHEHIRKTLDDLFDSQMKFTLEAVESIAHENSGKYRFCINKLRQ